MVVVHMCGGTEGAGAHGGKRPVACVVHSTLALPGGCPQARAAHSSVYIELVYTQRRIRYTLRAQAKTQCSKRATQRDETVVCSTQTSQKNQSNRETDSQNLAQLIRNYKRNEKSIRFQSPPHGVTGVMEPPLGAKWDEPTI